MFAISKLKKVWFGLYDYSVSVKILTIFNSPPVQDKLEKLFPLFSHDVLDNLVKIISYVIIIKVSTFSVSLYIL